MHFKTPFKICNGMLMDSEWKIFPIRPVRITLPETRESCLAFFQDCKDVNYIHLELDESLFTQENGALREDAAVLDALDFFMEESFHRGCYLGFTPITRRIRIPDGRSEHAIRDDEPIFAERFLDSLFRHINPLSGKKFYEYENLAAIEPIIALDSFTGKRLWTYLIHIRAFIEHFFLNRLLNIYLTDRGNVQEEHKDILLDYGQIIPLALFPEQNTYRIPPEMPGIRKAMFQVYAKKHGEVLFLPCAAAEAASQSAYFHVVHANGGAEGWFSVEADVPVDFRIVFPAAVKDAIYRPSMREKVPLHVMENTVSFTLNRPRYGVLEINYNSPDLPHYTVYAFLDPVIPCPQEDVLHLNPGVHETIDYAAAKTLHFTPGLHRLPGNRLRPISNHDIYLEQGAVLQCGLTCEKGKNIRIYGSGVFDGTEILRHPGENWKGRADDAFIHFFEGQNIEWDGPTIFNSPFWNMVLEGTHQMAIRHHKAVTWVGNNDGIQPRSCVDLLIEDCFLKCADDCIAIKTRRACGMESRNITVRNLVTWNDSGSSLEIGHTSQADLLENVSFENIEIVHALFGMCHIYIIDHSAVRNVVYRNIFIESNPYRTIPEISFTITENFYSTDSERGRIQNIVIENLHVMNHFAGISLCGFDEEHRIENVQLGNVFIHRGEEITQTNAIPYHTLKFADEIKRKK